ncbi:hypothetical protein ACQP2F_16805 [Actinoplanes sp. CA-030573]|uniref:hypothetical protein n=1 Tax=Actinoplanes sp. CA-030573 TaxID=3239898 RepID=UPI003D89BDF5
MERRVPGGRREIAGAVLTLSTMGGYSVSHDGADVGYLHASVGDQFNLYRRTADGTGDWLGKYRLEDGVRAILSACDQTGRAEQGGEGGRDAA